MGQDRRSSSVARAPSSEGEVSRWQWSSMLKEALNGVMQQSRALDDDDDDDDGDAAAAADDDDDDDDDDDAVASNLDPKSVRQMAT